MLPSTIRPSVTAFALLLALPSTADAQYAPAQSDGSSDDAWPTMTLDAPDPERIRSEEPAAPTSGGTYQLTSGAAPEPREPRAGGFEMGLFMPLVSIGGGSVSDDYDTSRGDVRRTDVGGGLFIGGGGPGFSGGFVTRFTFGGSDSYYEFGGYLRPRKQFGQAELFGTFGLGFTHQSYNYDTGYIYDFGTAVGFHTAVTGGLAFLRGPVHPYFDIGLIYRRVADGEITLKTYRMVIDIGVAFGG